MNKFMLKQLTPILCVETIEPSLPFWTKLGFALIVEVPDGDRLGFVILIRESVQIMYQTWRSLGQDLPALSQGSTSGSIVLYIDVDRLDDILPHLDGVEVIVPRRTTSYGADEIFVREPGGHVVGFAEHHE